MALFFTADTHFGDHRTINIHRRPFAGTTEMDAALVAGWNAVVGPEDEVWHLGDFARHQRDVAGLLARLNGAKHLVRGNNDAEAVSAEPGWASAQDYAELTVDGTLLVLCHYPFRSWNGQHRRSINLHGHSHGRLKPLPRQHDVGVDANGYRPVGWSELRTAALPRQHQETAMSDRKPTHLPAEGEGTPALPGETDLASELPIAEDTDHEAAQPATPREA